MPDDNKQEQSTDSALVKENRELSVRLTLAQAFVSLWIKAYGALLSYGINVRSLKEYKDTSMLDAAMKQPIEQGRGTIMEYIKRVESGISAAIRRKSFKPVE